MNHNHEYEVKLAVSNKLCVKAIKKIREASKGHTCNCKQHIIITATAILQFGSDVFGCRPEFYAALAILGDSIHDLVEEIEKTKTGEVILMSDTPKQEEAK